MNFKEQLALCMARKNFTQVDYADPENLLSLRRAVRMKCIECNCGDRSAAKECAITTCALYPYRAGRNPRPRAARPASPAQQAARERLRKARSTKFAT